MKRNGCNQKCIIVAFFFLFVVTNVCVADALSSTLQTFFGPKLQPLSCNGCLLNESFSEQIDIKQPFFAGTVIWSPDGKFIAVPSLLGAKINVYETSHWKLIGSLDRTWAGSGNSVFDFDSQSRHLLMPRIKDLDGYDVSSESWNFQSNSVSLKFYAIFQNEGLTSSYIEARDSFAKSLALNNDLLAVSVGGSNNGYIVIYDIKSTRIVRKIECTRYNAPTSISFSPNGRDISVSGCSHTEHIESYDISSGEMHFATEVDPASWQYDYISYSPDGALIAIGSSSGISGVLTVLNSASGQVVGVSPRERAEVSNLQWIDESHVLVSYPPLNPDGSVARIWDVNDMKVVGGFSAPNLQAVSLSPDGSKIAAVVGKDVLIENLDGFLLGE
jgi:WD40 repeat protein